VTADRCVSPGSPLPDATADFIEAAGRLAAAAAARGDRTEARRLLAAALRAVEEAGRTGAMLVLLAGHQKVIAG